MDRPPKPLIQQETTREKTSNLSQSKTATPSGKAFVSQSQVQSSNTMPVFTATTPKTSLQKKEGNLPVSTNQQQKQPQPQPQQQKQQSKLHSTIATPSTSSSSSSSSTATATATKPVHKDKKSPLDNSTPSTSSTGQKHLNSTSHASKTTLQTPSTGSKQTKKQTISTETPQKTIKPVSTNTTEPTDKILRNPSQTEPLASNTSSITHKISATGSSTTATGSSTTATGSSTTTTGSSTTSSSSSEPHLPSVTPATAAVTSTEENHTMDDDAANSIEDEDYDIEQYRCDICRNHYATGDNQIVFCEGCDLGVHQQCYGAPLTIEIPENEWFCDRCKFQQQNEKCVLCPETNGIMKRTSDWKWAHLSCAQWIPETYFCVPAGLDCIDYLQVPTHRFNRECMHCQKTNGATMNCCTAHCNNCFHITCGLNHNIYLKYQQNKKGTDLIVAYCEEHTSKFETKNKK